MKSIYNEGYLFLISKNKQAKKKKKQEYRKKQNKLKNKREYFWQID